MQEAFLQHIKQHKWSSPAQRILLTVSGGLDSMVMLHLFVSNGFSVGVAHCNFQLRGRESEGDEQLVSEKCAQLKVPFYVNRFDTNNYATQQGISIQMAARELRYVWFNEVAAKEGYGFIATAHHLNDSVETTLLHLIHGRGADGLTGIVAQNGNIIRPLLFASRKEIEQYAADHHIAWREDSSNQSDDYQRNYIRHQIIPRLKEINPSLEEAIQRSIRKTEGILELTNDGLVAFAEKHVVKEGARVSINKSVFHAYSNPEAVLYQVIKSYGYSLDQCDQIITALQGQVGKQFFSSSHQLVIDRDHLIITPQGNSKKEVRIDEGQYSIAMGDLTMELKLSDDNSITTDRYTVSLDADQIAFPLTWRTWREGDAFIPLGMKGRKKVSDFLIDNKVALNDKAGVTVIESNGEIVWLVGHRIGHHFRITNDTKRILRLKVSS